MEETKETVKEQTPQAPQVQSGYISLNDIIDRTQQLGVFLEESKWEPNPLNLLSMLCFIIRALKISGMNFKQIYLPVKTFYNLPMPEGIKVPEESRIITL